MHTRSLLVGALALALSASESRASDMSRFINNDCSPALVTCASVQVRFSRFTQNTEPMITVGLRNLSGTAHPSVSVRGATRFQSIFAGNVSSPLAGPQIISGWNGDDGRNWECRPGGEDCQAVEDPTTTTPEPITMTLLATGLVGMGGVSGIRRRLKGKRKEGSV